MGWQLRGLSALTPQPPLPHRLANSILTSSQSKCWWHAIPTRAFGVPFAPHPRKNVHSAQRNADYHAGTGQLHTLNKTQNAVYTHTHIHCPRHSLMLFIQHTLQLPFAPTAPLTSTTATTAAVPFYLTCPFLTHLQNGYVDFSTLSYPDRPRHQTRPLQLMMQPRCRACRLSPACCGRIDISNPAMTGL